MTLPPSYHTSKEYVADSLGFLKAFHWIFNSNNTHILVDKVLNNFPTEWFSYFDSLSIEELNQLPVGVIKEDCPISLKNTLNKLESLKPHTAPFSQKCDYNLSHNSGLSRKKLHEIKFLAPLIDKVCKENEADFIIDVGSGLGYLSHLLNYSYGYSVLGIECSPDKIDSAYKNQHKYFPNSKDLVKFAEHFINEESCEKIKQLTPENTRTCLAGLHACADLSITILDLFTKLDFVNCLVIMPCCYHRIKLERTVDEKEYFSNFPASDLFKDLWGQFEAEKFVRRPFLRLACQQTVQSFVDMSKEEHDKHSRSCMYRAILQDVVESEHCRVKRLRRKSGKTHLPDIEDDFQAYLNNLCNTHQLEYTDDITDPNRTEINSERFLMKMQEKWKEQKNNCYLVEVLTALQASLQSLCENLILLDRVEFLKEKGFDCYVQKVTDDSISPRCYALVAVKC